MGTEEAFEQWNDYTALLNAANNSMPSIEPIATQDSINAEIARIKSFLWFAASVNSSLGFTSARATLYFHVKMFIRRHKANPNNGLFNYIMEQTSHSAFKTRVIRSIIRGLRNNDDFNDIIKNAIPKSKYTIDNYIVESLNSDEEFIHFDAWKVLTHIYDAETLSNHKKSDAGVLSYEVVSLFETLGYGIAPNQTKTRCNFGVRGEFIAYKKVEDYYSFDRKIENSMALVYVKLAAILLNNAENIDRTLIYVDENIDAFTNPSSDKQYFKALFRWLLSRSTPIHKNIINGVIYDTAELNRLLNSLIELCCIMSDISAIQLNKLKKIYAIFGVDSLEIHSRIHRMQTGDEFATIVKVENRLEFMIPKQGEVKTKFSLDTHKLSKLEEQTKESHDMLSEIFTSEDAGSTEVVAKTTSDPALEILNILLNKECWARAEVEELCKSRRLIIGFVLERINDFAYAKINDSVIEDDGDDIYITTEYKDKLL